jgi:hypothetical protein
MALPVTIPNTFANATASIPLSQLDTNFTTLANAVNGISSGSETLANASVTVLTAGTANVTTLNTSGQVVFNDAGADVDFRVEGDTDANLLFVDASADAVLIGTNTAASTQGGNLQVITAQAIRRNVASSAGGALRLEKSRSATDGGYTIVQDGDSLGDIQWFGSDGVDFAQAATIRGIVNGTPGSNDMPGALAFLTSADGSQTPTERMRITSDGEVLVGGTTSVDAKSGAVAIESATGGNLNLIRNDTSTSTGEALGEISFWGNDTGSPFTRTKFAYINATASGTHSSGDNPIDLVFGVTENNSSTVYEALRIKDDGTLDSQDTYDNTQSGSTVVVTSAGLIGRTSSSIKYKKDVETLDAELVDNAITNLRPVWYRTKEAKGDDKETWSHIGLIAEEVHEVEPRLVRYRTEKVEFVDVEEQVTKTREVSPSVTDEEGNVVQEAVTEEYTETVTRKEKQKDSLETPEPEDVDYGRLAVLCLAKIQQLEARIAALEGQ